MRFLSVDQAAVRVGRSPRTIGRWLDDGLRSHMGFVQEVELLAHEKRMRERRGRPRKARALSDAGRSAGAPTEEQVERVARAIANDKYPNVAFGLWPGYTQDVYRRHARAAIAAYVRGEGNE